MELNCIWGKQPTWALSTKHLPVQIVHKLCSTIAYSENSADGALFAVVHWADRTHHVYINWGHSLDFIWLLPSADKMFVIKTMTTEEIEQMHHLLKQVSNWLETWVSFPTWTLPENKINQASHVVKMLLSQYHPYIVERDGKTLLPQFLGMYRYHHHALTLVHITAWTSGCYIYRHHHHALTFVHITVCTSG